MASRLGPARGSQVPGPGRWAWSRSDLGRAGLTVELDRKRPASRVKDVTTSSTTTRPGLVTRDAGLIARTFASPRVGLEGPVSGLRMLSSFTNRAGRRLSTSRQAELEKAKRLMRQGIEARRARR